MAAFCRNCLNLALSPKGYQTRDTVIKAIGANIFDDILGHFSILDKPRIFETVKTTMKDTDHVKFIWQLLALCKRMDVDPYGLTQNELLLLQSYDLTKTSLTTSQ